MALFLIDSSCSEHPLASFRGFMLAHRLMAAGPTIKSCRKNGLGNVIVDLVNVTRMNASDQSALVQFLCWHTRNDRGRLVLANVRPKVAEIMAANNLHRILKNVGSLAKAVEYYSSIDEHKPFRSAVGGNPDHSR